MAFIHHQLFGKRRFRLLFVLLTVLVLAAAVAITYFESQSSRGMINNFFDGLWWSVVTVATVGYGDIVPVTTAGRIVGMVLIGVGVPLYLTIFVIVGTTLSESQERFHWRRTVVRLDEIDTKLEEIRKGQQYLVEDGAKKSKT